MLSVKATAYTMTRSSLAEAPKGRKLIFQTYDGLGEDEAVVLTQLGFHENAEIEKVHNAPLGDPVTIRIGEKMISLRKSYLKHMMVEWSES